MALKLRKKSHDLLIDLVMKIQERHKQNSEFRDKLSAIDIEYATHKVSISSSDNPNASCDGQSTTIEGIKVPLMGSEIDSITANLASKFVARQPIFPVLAMKSNWDEAMALQAAIDRDARLQRWGKEILLFISRTCRYNTAALAVEKTYVRSPLISNNNAIGNNSAEIQYNTHTYTSLKSIDMYNYIYDPRVPPTEVATRGEYNGYNEIITRSELKMLGTNLSKKEMAYNLDKAYESTLNNKDQYYFYPPDISDYITKNVNETEVNWLDWLGILETDSTSKKYLLKEDTYLKTVLYIRIIPFEFDLGYYKSPEIWKLTIINNQIIISLERVITPFDYLPILTSDIREDGLGWQTKSPGENILPYEDAATELLNVRLNGSRRAISDRAIYDQNYIDSNHVNDSNPTAKIPLKADLRNFGDRPKLSELYWPIPFEGQGVVNALTDLNTVMSIKDQVNGQNFTSRGERQKGNRTAAEYNDIAATTDEKSLPYALRLEQQVFNPLKQIIKIFILINPAINPGEDKIVDLFTEEERELDLNSVRSAALEFKLTDGLYTKQSFVPPEVLSVIMQTMATNEVIAQEYDVGRAFAELLHIYNIDLNKFRRNPNAIQAAPSPAPQPGPGTPNAGQPTGGPQVTPQA